MNALNSRLISCSLFIVLFVAGCNSDTPLQGIEQPQLNASTAAAQAPAADLHSAVISGNVEVVRQHIQAGSDINQPDPFGGSSPLISAATFGQTEIAHLLIDAGAHIDYTNDEGSTALHSAAFFCHLEILDALLNAGANKTIVNQYGNTAYDSVAGPFNQARPFYDAIGPILTPMGLILDYDRLKATRPLVAAALR